MAQRLAKSLLAVLAGNAIYFWLLVPRLPEAGRHRPYRFDLGLLIDFWICLVCYGLLTLAARMRHEAR